MRVPEPTSPLRTNVAILAVVGVLAMLAVGTVSVRFGVFVSLCAALGIGFYRLYASVKPVDWLSPGFGLLLFLFLYSVAPALLVEHTGTTDRGEPVDEILLLQYYAACLLGLFGLAAGLVLARRPRKPEASTHQPFLQLSDATYFKVTIVGAVITGALFFRTVASGFDFREVPSYAERAMAIRLEAKAAIDSGPQEVVLRSIPTAFILCSACLLFFRTKWWLTRGLGIVLFVPYLITNTLAGWRGVVIWAGLIPVVFYHYRVKRLRLPQVVTLGALTYLFMNGLALVRHTSNAGEMWSAFNSNVAENGLGFARLDSAGELMVGANLMTLIHGLQNGTAELTWGASLLTELAVFVPRMLYADRPLPLGEQFAKGFFPRVYENGGGFGFFCIMEGYWALGMVGAFLFMLGFGWSVEKIYQWFLRHMHSDFVAFWYHAVFVTLVVVSVRNGIMGTYKFALMNSLPFLLVAAAASFRPKPLALRQVKPRGQL